MVNVLIVEDSRVVSEYLHYILNKDPDIQVIGNVSNGQKAIEFMKNNKPDVITMDIDMPVMDGLEATRIIMSTTPVPIIIVTASRNINEVRYSMDALAAGALSIVEKPAGIGHPDEEKLASELTRMVKLMAEVKVVTRRHKVAQSIEYSPQPINKDIQIKKFTNKKIIAIGVSSGGPIVLKKIFAEITAKFPYPILIVQHITEGFLEGLVSWLNNVLKINIKVAEHGEVIKSGHIYFAPNSYQMGVDQDKSIKLVSCTQENICPSVSYLFESVVEIVGKDAIGIILTGMGKDGANELKLLKEAGALTIAQDKQSSLVHGMPGVAIGLNAADYILNPEEIAETLKKIEIFHIHRSVLNTSQMGNGHEKERRNINSRG